MRLAGELCYSGKSRNNARQSLARHALDGFDALYPTFSAPGREWETESVADLTAQLAYALVLTQNEEAPIAAASALERGRTRAQSLTLRRQVVLSKAAALLPPELYARFRDASKRLDILALSDRVPNTIASRERLSRKEAAGLITKRIDTDLQLALATKEAVTDYERVLVEIRQTIPEFPQSGAHENAPLAEAASLLDPDEGLAYVAHTPLGAVAILIYRPQANRAGPVAQARCDEWFTNEAVGRVLFRRKRAFWRWTDDGLLPAQYGVGDGHVKAAIEALGAADCVIVKLANACQAAGLRRLVLIPCGLFGLLPLHAAPIARGIARSEPFLDVVQVSYTPSFRMWALSRSRAKPTGPDAPNALVIGNALPQPPGFQRLKAAEAEAEIIGAFVSGETDGHVVRLEREDATRAPGSLDYFHIVALKRCNMQTISSNASFSSMDLPICRRWNPFTSGRP
jgi:hypothetical protein